jgi:hypothetical protein
MIINTPIFSSGSIVVGDGDYRVRFFDYDGTLLREQWVNTGESATPPTPPAHAGLTFGEWNHACSNITRYTDVGATYATTDGKTHAVVRLTTTTGKAISLNLSKSDSSTLSIDWGDGVVNTIANTGSFNTGARTYANTGVYTIKIWISSGSGTYTCGYDAIPLCSHSTQMYNALRKLFVGNNVTSVNVTNTYQINEIVIPVGATLTSAYSSALKACILPRGTTAVPGQCFQSNPCLTALALPDTIATIGSLAYGYTKLMNSLVLPSSLTTLDANAFNGAAITMYDIHMPASVTSIGATAFSGCGKLDRFILLAETPPLLANINAFNGILYGARFYVLDASVDAYKAATNWITYANYIFPISEM